MINIIRRLFLITALFLTAQTQAQIDVRLEPIRRDLILGEQVQIKLILANRTDSTLQLRNSLGRQWLNFQVYDPTTGNSMAPKARAKFPVVTLAPGSQHSFQINISPYFSFPQPGVYHVAASVIMPDNKTLYPSNRTGIAISAGSNLRSFTAQANGKRLKISAKTLRLEDKNCLFGQVLGADTNYPIGACFMGQYLNFMEPKIMLDGAQNLHCLFQSTPSYFTYAVMSPEGRRLSQKILERSGGPVDLISTGKGLRPTGLTPRKPKSKTPEPTHSAADRPF